MDVGSHEIAMVTCLAQKSSWKNEWFSLEPLAQCICVNKLQVNISIMIDASCPLCNNGCEDN